MGQSVTFMLKVNMQHLQRHLYLSNGINQLILQTFCTYKTFSVWTEQVISRIMHPKLMSVNIFASHLSFLSHSESSINKKVKVCLQAKLSGSIMQTGWPV